MTPSYWLEPHSALRMAAQATCGDAWDWHRRVMPRAMHRTTRLLALAAIPRMLIVFPLSSRDSSSFYSVCLHDPSILRGPTPRFPSADQYTPHAQEAGPLKAQNAVSQILHKRTTTRHTCLRQYMYRYEGDVTHGSSFEYLKKSRIHVNFHVFELNILLAT